MQSNHTMKLMILLLVVVVSAAIVNITGCGGGGSTSSGGSATGSSSSSTSTPTQSPSPAATFVGSSTCSGCHGSSHPNAARGGYSEADFNNSGHPYKLTKVTNGQAPTYPFSSVPNPPAGYTWNDITYVIGGYGWKARFIDKNGYIITGKKVANNDLSSQYNLATQAWSVYEGSTQVGTKPYDCGECHTTGWTPSGGPGGEHQDGLPGMWGTFKEPGVRCEACHGAGSNHAQNPSASNITVDRSSLACGKCHYRDPNYRILSSKSGTTDYFIQHHEQYEELTSAKHKDLLCVSCHNVHKSTHYGQGGASNDICATCHSLQAENLKHPAGPKCIDCHMPKAGKSAVTSNRYIGDLKTHTFKIFTEPYWRDGFSEGAGPTYTKSATADTAKAMFYQDPGNTKWYARGYVTLDFACFGCHKDAGNTDIGGTGSSRHIYDLSVFAKGMH